MSRVDLGHLPYLIQRFIVFILEKFNTPILFILHGLIHPDVRRFRSIKK